MLQTFHSHASQASCLRLLFIYAAFWYNEFGEA
jgi:hypothetical protein